MKRAAIAVVVYLCVSAAAQSPKPTAKSGSSSSALETKIRQSWEDFKNHKQDAYAADLADDSTQVWADNKAPRDKATAIKDMLGIKLDSYSLSNMKITMLGPDAALATYQAKVSFTADGNKMSPMLAITDVWVKRGGEWKNLRYQESEIK